MTTRLDGTERMPARRWSELVEVAEQHVDRQIMLLRCELQRASRQLLVPAMLLLVAGVVLLSSIPLLLITVAAELARVMALPLAWVLLMVVAMSSCAALIVGVIALQRLNTIRSPFRHLRRELVRDLRWLKSRFG